jgi:hypothetical protein
MRGAVDEVRVFGKVRRKEKKQERVGTEDDPPLNL